MTGPWARSALRGRWLAVLALVASLGATAVVAKAPKVDEEFPQFIVPGHKASMIRLQHLFKLHYGRRTRCTLWDGWLPMSNLWPAVGPAKSAADMRAFYRRMLLERPIDREGYVSMQQHRGLAHSEGWPFPTWPQAGGAGWHFSLVGDAYAVSLGVKPTESLNGWHADGFHVDPPTSLTPLSIAALVDKPGLTTPPIRVDSLVAPFVRLEWEIENAPPEAKPFIAWTTEHQPQFDVQRRMYFQPRPARSTRITPHDDPDVAMGYTNIPVYRHPQWTGVITRLRFGLEGATGARVRIKSLITAVDSRHPITNTRFIQASTDLFNWTTDLNFLRDNIQRMRLALQYALDEFDAERQRCVVVPWVGHDGRAGFFIAPDGTKVLLHGRGVGNNYWDLMPFGHEDCLATIYLYDALRRMSRLERQIAVHPQWNIPAGPLRQDSDELAVLAHEIRQHAGQRFFNADTGRFVACIDADGNAHDFGFTFLNTEAIHHDFATAEQAQSIMQWIDGQRHVDDDTSQRDDIYHWRFGPRSTTRRNVQWYGWVWNRPEAIPWGGQVQDGGAVLGFSYYDLMARIKTLGPDSAQARLDRILDWFAEVQRRGGYREFYNSGEDGTLQGGGQAGGLGLDAEFMESVLVPQVMLYGFLGFQPLPEGFAIDPYLPQAWPSLAITRIHVQRHVLDIQVAGRAITITNTNGCDDPLEVTLPPGRWQMQPLGPAGQEQGPETAVEVQPEGPPLILRLVTPPAVRLERDINP